MIKEILSLLFIFVFPIINLIWELFYNNIEEKPSLTKQNRRNFHIQFIQAFFVSLLVSLWCTISFAIMSLIIITFKDADSFVVFEFSGTSLSNPLLNLFVPFLVFWMDMMVGGITQHFIAPCWGNGVYTSKWRKAKWRDILFNWKFAKECWPIYSVLVGNAFWFIHGPFVFLTLPNMPTLVCLLVIFTYPISSYSYSKEMYSYYLYYEKKGLLKKFLPFLKGNTS